MKHSDKVFLYWFLVFEYAYVVSTLVLFRCFAYFRYPVYVAPVIMIPPLLGLGLFIKSRLEEKTKIKEICPACGDLVKDWETHEC